MFGKIFELFVEYIITPVFIGVFAYIFTKIKKFIAGKWHSIELNSSKSIKIHSLLGECRIKTRSERCYLSLFHNGDKYIDGSPCIKISRISEVCAPGISHENTNFQGLLISTIPEMVGDLIDNKNGIIIETERLPQGRLKSILETEGVATAYKIPIYKDKAVVGLIGVDYFDQTEENKATFEVLRHYGSLISTILVSKK